jgi:hypothetical protein
MPGTLIPSSIARKASDYFGDYVTEQHYGVVGNGSTDDAPALNRAITSLIGLGGRELHLHGGRTFLLNSPLLFPTGNCSLRIIGHGKSSLFKRGANIPAGKGLFDIAGSTDLQFENFGVDGAVTTPVGLKYTVGATQGDFYNGSSGSDDPMAASLTGNSSFWVHGGSKRIRFSNIYVTHTGGYTILLDASAVGDVSDVTVLDSMFENNRPHLFGFAGTSDLTYGSWTSGIHYQGDGASYGVKNLTVSRNTFRRNSGNQIWGHLYGFGKLHSNIRVDNNHFEDIGLDGVEMGGVIGGSVEGNTFRRIGYICTDDTAPSVPKWLSNKNATGLDTSGLVRGVNYKGNSFLNVNGGFIDADCYSQGTISDNVCIISRPGEPEYVEDLIGTGQWGPPGTSTANNNWSYGVQIGNSSWSVSPAGSIAGKSANITGNTFVNCGGGAVRLYAGRNCTVYGNTVDHSLTGMNVAPFVLGPTGTDPNQRATGNVITGNTISWPLTGGASVGVVQEDPTLAVFVSSDKNWVTGNKLINSAFIFEFYSDTNSASSTKTVHSSNLSHLSVASENVVQRESGYLRTYVNAGGTLTSLSTLLDKVTLPLDIHGAAVYGGPLLNISSGAGVGGVVSTGGRTTSAYDDAVVTGKLTGDAFIALGTTTYLDADANQLDGNWLLLRRNSVSGVAEISTSVSAGARVWSALSTGGFTNPISGSLGINTTDFSTITALSGSNGIAIKGTTERGALDFQSGSGDGVAHTVGAMSFTDITSTAAEKRVVAMTVTLDGTVANKRGGVLRLFTKQDNGSSLSERLRIDNTGLTTVTGPGTSSTAALAIAPGTGFIQSNDGFVVPTNTAFNAIQAPLGGVYANQITSGSSGVYVTDSTLAFTTNVPLAAVVNSGTGFHGVGFNPVWVNSVAYNAISIYTVNSTNVKQGWGGIDLGRVTFEDLPADQTGGAGACIIYSKGGHLWAMEGTTGPTRVVGSGSGFLPVTAPAGYTYPCGIVGESTYAIMDVGINDTLFGTQITAKPGSFIRFNGSGSGTAPFTLFGRASTSSTNNPYLTMTEAGLFTFGNLTQIDQLGNVSMIGVLAINGAAAGINVLTTTAYNSIQTTGGVSAKSTSVYDSLGPWTLATVFNPGLASRAPYLSASWIRSSAFNALQIFAVADGESSPGVIGTKAWGGVDLGRITFEDLGAAQTGAAGKGIIYFNSGHLYAVEGAASPVQLLTSGGSLSVPLVLSADDPNTTESSAQLQIRGTTDSRNTLALGFNTTGNYSWIQSNQVGVATRDLHLQPNGGFVKTLGAVTIGSFTDPTGAFMLDVEGSQIITGAGQATGSFNPAGALGSCIYLHDTGAAGDNGGVVMFGNAHGSSAAIKSRLTNGTGPQSDLSIQGRKLSTDANLTEIAKFSPTNASTLQVFGNILTTTALVSSAVTGTVINTGLGTFLVDSTGNVTASNVIATPVGVNVTTTALFNSIQSSGGLNVTQVNIHDGIGAFLLASVHNPGGASRAPAFNPVWINSTAFNALQIFAADSSGNNLGFGGIDCGTIALESFAWNALACSGGARWSTNVFVGFPFGFDVNTNPYSSFGYLYTGLAFQVQGNGQSSSFVADSYGNVVAFRGRVANGSLAAPSAATANTQLCTITAHGFVPGLSGQSAAGGFPVSSCAKIGMNATETHTSSGGTATRLGSEIIFSTTLNGTASNLGRVKIANDGSLQVANTSGSFVSGLRFNTGTAKLQFSNDLSSWTDLGSSGGGGGTPSTFQIDNASPDTQFYISNSGPRIALGNTLSYASRTMSARLVMSTSAGQFGLAAGDTWLFTESINSGTAGTLWLGGNSQQTLKLDIFNHATFASNLVVTGSFGGSSLVITNGYVLSSEGFQTPSASFNAIDITGSGGGMQCYRHTFQTLGSAPTGAAGKAIIYFDGSILKAVQGASAPVALIGGGGGGSTTISTTAGVGLTAVLTGSNYAVNIDTTSNAHFGTLTTNGVFQSGASGAAIAFQNTNFNFSVDGNGNISGSGACNMSQGYKVVGTSVINNAGAYIGPVCNVSATGATIAFQTQNFNFQVNGNGSISGAQKCNMTQGFQVGGTDVINSSRQFVGAGVNTPFNGITTTGVNITNAGTGTITGNGQTVNVSGSFNIGGVGRTVLIFQGGVLVSYA